mgnify:CR=1 FL=1
MSLTLSLSQSTKMIVEMPIANIMEYWKVINLCFINSELDGKLFAILGSVVIEISENVLSVRAIAIINDADFTIELQLNY